MDEKTKPIIYMLRLSVRSAFIGSSKINPEAAFLRIFTVAFFLFLTTAGGSNPWGYNKPLTNLK